MAARRQQEERGRARKSFSCPRISLLSLPLASCPPPLACWKSPLGGNRKRSRLIYGSPITDLFIGPIVPSLQPSPPAAERAFLSRRDILPFTFGRSYDAFLSASVFASRAICQFPDRRTGVISNQCCLFVGKLARG